MPIIAQNAAVYTEIVLFTVNSEKQQELVDAIVGEVNRWIRYCPGFLSASYHLSIDGTRVINYAQWQSEEAWRNFKQDPQQKILRAKIQKAEILTVPDARGYTAQQIIETPQALSPIITGPDQIKTYTHIPATRGYIALTGAQTGNAFFLISATAAPGEPGPMRHVHTREEETWYILEGEYEFQIGDQLQRVSAGATVFGPRDVPHTFHNVGSGMGRVLIWVSPAGLENFFVSLDNILRQGQSNPQQTVELARRYGITFLP